MVLLDERHDIVSQLEAAEDPVEALEQNTSDIAVKTAGIAMYCDIGNQAIDQLDAQIKRLQERKKVIKARIDRVKDYTLSAMQVHGLRKIECPECTLIVQKNPYKVEIDDERMIPAEFWIYPPAPAPYVDKEKVKKAFLDDGEVVQGTRVIQTEGLRIR